MSFNIFLNFLIIYRFHDYIALTMSLLSILKIFVPCPSPLALSVVHSAVLLYRRTVYVLTAPIRLFPFLAEFIYLHPTSMSAMIQQSPSWAFSAYGRMSSVEELDSSLTLLSRHGLGKSLPMTPPGTPSMARSPEQAGSSFDYAPDSPNVRIPPNTPVTPMLSHPMLQQKFAAAMRVKTSRFVIYSFGLP